MSVASRLQCARQFLVSLLPTPGTAAVPMVEDLLVKPEAKDMLHDLRITVCSPEGVEVHGQLPALDLDSGTPTFAVGSMQVRHMGRVICTLHASSA